jgi:peptidyl-prolyl cis-trans isomerase A (cyclophilin A)
MLARALSYRSHIRSLAFLLSLTSACASAQRSSSSPSLPRVLIATEAGAIVAEIDTIHAPITGGNFLRYVDGRFFTNGRFNRTVTLQNQTTDSVRIEVIQASIDSARNRDQFPPIALERTRETGLNHLDGTLSMARAGPETARSSFFICINGQPALDFGGHRNLDGQGFAAFGRVITGMDVVRRIQNRPYEAQRLTPPIRIDSVVRK